MFDAGDNIMESWFLCSRSSKLGLVEFHLPILSPKHLGLGLDRLKLPFPKLEMGRTRLKLPFLKLGMGRTRLKLPFPKLEAGRTRLKLPFLKLEMGRTRQRIAKCNEEPIFSFQHPLNRPPRHRMIPRFCLLKNAAGVLVMAVSFK